MCNLHVDGRCEVEDGRECPHECAYLQDSVREHEIRLTVNR